jgi:hypothetical protein
VAILARGFNLKSEEFHGSYGRFLAARSELWPADFDPEAPQALFMSSGWSRLTAVSRQAELKIDPTKERTISDCGLAPSCIPTFAAAPVSPSRAHGSILIVTASYSEGLISLTTSRHAHPTPD